MDAHAASSETKADEGKRSIISRRDLIAGLGGAAALGVIGALAIASPANAQVRPPGGQDEDHVLAACVHCELCYEACPHDVIAPAHIEDGFAGMRTPVMKFSKDYCTFCKGENDSHPLCVQVCPTGALRLSDMATARETIIGRAVIVEKDCLAYRSITCHYCRDACPYDAIEMDEGDQPHVVEDKCNGCGACEAVCVSLKNGSSRAGQTRRAIHVDPVQG